MQPIAARRPLGKAMANLLVATWVCFSICPADSGAPGSGVESRFRGGPLCSRGPLVGDGNWTPFGQVRGRAGRMARGQFAQRISLKGGDGEEGPNPPQDVLLRDHAGRVIKKLSPEEEAQAATERLQKAAAERLETRQAAADKAWADGGGKDVGELPSLEGDFPALEGERGEQPIEDYIWSKEFGETFNPLFMTGMTEEEVRVLNHQPSTINT